ncbi:DNA-DAMAGE-REPAIR/TOLERATION PROTEIN DRT100-LIKE, partial [Salix purpurea]
MTTLEELYLDRSALPINFLHNIGQLNALKILSVSDCNLTGTLPTQGLDGLKNVEQLDLSGNKLEDISDNQFSGILPTRMGNFSNLKAIDLSRNHFDGPLPRDFCKLDSLEYLDLSDNNLSGSVPSCFNPSSIRHVHLSKNQLSGPLTEAFYNSSFLVTLDIADNNLMGPISNWIGNLSALSVLLMRANQFAGDLPT